MLLITTLRTGIAAGTIGMSMACPVAAAPLTVNKDVILAEHNKYRAEVGVPPLKWSDNLAEGAQRW